MATLDDYDWEGDADMVQATMEELYPELMKAAYLDNLQMLPGISFDVSNPAIKKTIEGLAQKIRGVSDTTRASIQALVDEQTEKGWSTDELAKAIRDLGEVDSVWRSEMIARTESASAYNLGAMHAYEDAGIGAVDVYDGDDDAECAAANGARWTIEEARANPIGHPNCTRAFSAVVE